MATLTYSNILEKWFSTGCPICEREEEERERAIGEKIANEERRKKREQKFRERGIPARFKDTTIADYVADTQRKKEVLEIINGYISDQATVSKTGRSLLLYGNVGTGKTRLATSIVKGWDGVGYYITAREYTRLVRSTYSTAARETEQDIIDRFADYSILVIDEIGRQFATEYEQHAIFDIINVRYNELRPTILISNMNLEGVLEFLGEATLDRIKENNGQAILFDWESFR